MKNVCAKLYEYRVLPVVTIEDMSQAVLLAKALCDGGLPCAEITFRTEAAADSLRMIGEAFPDMLVGAGTVQSVEQADAAVENGAAFIVSPGFNEDVVRHCLRRNIPVFPGIATPSELDRAAALGLTVVKFFPAEACGGIRMIKALSGPYHQIRFMPTGGITPANLPQYLRLPNVIACGGSWMVDPELIRKGDFTLIRELTEEAARLAKDDVQPQKSHKKVFDFTDRWDKRFDIVALGEPLLRLSPPGKMLIEDAPLFEKHVGGSELNVVSAIASMGLSAAFVSKLPKHAMGRVVRRAMRASGVRDDYIVWDKSPDARLGLYYYEYGASPRKPAVCYDRAHTSVTTLRGEEIPDEIYKNARLFHVSGITLALAESLRTLAPEMIKRFRAEGSLISFDVNYRASLWDEDTARKTIEGLLPLVDILFVSEETSRRMMRRTGTWRQILHGYAEDFGVKVVVSSARTVQSSTCHTWRSILYSAMQRRFFEEEPYDNIEVIDRIGSGDAFVAGVLYGILKENDLDRALRLGNAAAVLKNTLPGDQLTSGIDAIHRIVEDHHALGSRDEMTR